MFLAAASQRTKNIRLAHGTEPFGYSMEDKRALWENGLRAVIPMFRDRGCEYDGPYFSDARWAI